MRNEIQKDKIIKELKAEFNIDSINAAKKELDKMTAELEKKNSELEKSYEQFVDKYKKQLDLD